MPRSGSVYNYDPTGQRLNDFVKRKVAEYDLEIAKLRAARAATPVQTAPPPETPPYSAYAIPSNSDPSKTYDVVLYNDGSKRAECNCKGYGFRRRCSHIDDARALCDAGLDGTAEVYTMPEVR